MRRQRRQRAEQPAVVKPRRAQLEPRHDARREELDRPKGDVGPQPLHGLWRRLTERRVARREVWVLVPLAGEGAALDLLVFHPVA